jgi:thiol:disulfide interchange protein
MICDDKSVCKPPKSIPFKLGVAPADSAMAAAALPGTGTREAAVPGILDISSFRLIESDPPTDLWMNLVFAFLGGLLLNVMPCVLPVIAIKVLSFVQQAGENRGRILALNCTYSLGVIAVFLVLAALAVFLGEKGGQEWGWGALFQDARFNIVMAAIVFAMGLSLLGVFEIPVPGMIGSAASGHREGLIGAFSTGVFATLLATPCTGPFMGTTLAWSLKQEALIVFLVWGVMGLGMAFPYLIIGVFPKLVYWLPKPGMWMVRFKEFAGFVLMGTVVWILTSLTQDLLIPTLVILIGIALALWKVGNLYNHSTPLGRKWAVRDSA